MIVRPNSVPALPVIDIRHNGIGDVVVACWLIHSALAAGIAIRLNPRQQHQVADLLSIPADLLTDCEAADWSTTAALGHQYEYRVAASRGVTRFDAWAESLHLPPLVPVRPPYDEQDEDGRWADEQWLAIGGARSRPRILIFPDTAWTIRAWPKAYFIDLVATLQSSGATVAAMSATSAFVAHLPCHWLAGFSLRRIAALARRASMVIANDSGPAHLAAAIGTPTMVICGPTDPAIVFAHEPNIRAAVLDREMLSCVSCHFSAERGFRAACDVGGCQALMRLDPGTIAALALGSLTSACSREIAHA